MKIEEVKILENETFGNVDSIEANISSESTGVLFDIMSKHLYSNPIGSIIREITSNCFDSHKEANVDDAVVIEIGEDDFGNDDEKYFISFKDFGVGLSPERIKNVYMNYLSSTKRDTNEQIGGWGLGSKTPLSYTSYFYITTIFDKIKYSYILSKTGQKPSLDLLSEDNTEERNGTEIKIYIKNYKDLLQFKKELNQLAYFDNIFFINCDIDNDYKIIETDTFKYRSENQYSDEFHIVLGKVCYPINWKLINLQPIEVPVGVKFQIGELQVTPSREDLQYNEEIINFVKERILKVKQDLIDLFVSQNKPFENYFDWVKNKSLKPYINFEVGDNNFKLYLTGFDEVSKKHKCTILEGLDYDKFEPILNYTYKVVGIGRIPYKSNESYSYCNLFDIINYKKNHLLTKLNNINESIAYNYKGRYFFKAVHDYVHNIKKKDYYGANYFINFDEKKYNKFKNITPLAFNYSTVRFESPYHHFNLGIALKTYKAIKHIREQVESNLIKFNGLNEEELKSYKIWKTENDSTLKRRLEQKVFCKNISGYQDFEWQAKEIDAFTGIVIYGFREDVKKLENSKIILSKFKTLFNVTQNDKNYFNPKAVKVILISKQNEKYFKNKSNMIHIDNLYSDNKIFRQYASYLKIQNYFKNVLKNQSSMNAKSFIEEMKKISKEVGNNLETLYTYYKTLEQTSNDYFYDRAHRQDSLISDAVLKVAEQYNLFDTNIEIVFKQLDNWFKDVELILYTELNDETIPYILKLLKEKKKKLNLEYYQKFVLENKIIPLKHNRTDQLGIEFVVEEETKTTKLKFITNKTAA